MRFSAKGALVCASVKAEGLRESISKKFQTNFQYFACKAILVNEFAIYITIIGGQGKVFGVESIRRRVRLAGAH